MIFVFKVGVGVRVGVGEEVGFLVGEIFEVGDGVKSSLFSVGLGVEVSVGLGDMLISSEGVLLVPK